MSEVAQDLTDVPPTQKRKGGRQPGQTPRKLDEVDVMMRARKLIETLAPGERSLVASYISSKFGPHHA